MRRHQLAWTIAFLLLAPQILLADVSRIEIDRREPFAQGHSFGRTGPYEVIAGRLYFETDPADAANRRVADLQLAPVNAEGKVESWADFFLLTPADSIRGNGCLLYDVHNRGNKLALWVFNEGEGTNDPVTLEHAGNGFLLERGFSILWTGWNGDVAEDGTNRLLAGLPVAVNEDGSTVTGRTWVEILVNEPVYSRDFAWSPWGIAKAYPAVSLDNTGATLTMRQYRSDPPVEVPSDQWAFARWEDGNATPDPTSVYVKDGFKPGWLYDLVYTAKDPRVSGLGLTGLRDAISFFRYHRTDDNPLSGSINRAIIFGVSQSGRVVHHFLYEGWNADSSGRMVFDAALIHVAGAGKGMFNHRFGLATSYGAQHQGRLFPSEFFPFAPTEQVDPVSGERGESLERLRSGEHVPKIFFVQTSSEYWERAASLLHTDVEGTRDIPLDPNVRLYHIAGAGHLGAMPTEPGTSQNPRNPLRHRGPILRALLVALDAWQRDGVEPPESRYPQIDDGTLVDLETWRSQFPQISGVNLPQSHYEPWRLNLGPDWHSQGVATVVPPEIRGTYRTLVPAVDADGNEVAGIRLPDVAVPLATYTGWNLRAPSSGAEKSLDALQGSYLKFPISDPSEESEEKGTDPRLPLSQRYASPEAYLGQYAATVLDLQAERFLLEADALDLLREAAARDIFNPR